MADITPLHPEPHPEFVRGREAIPELVLQIAQATNKHVGIHTTILMKDDQPVFGWCVHADPGSDLGCRRYTLIEALLHVQDEHADGGNCGE